MELKDSTLGELLQRPDFFIWATGIEDTFITAPWAATGRTLDEYELTQHYQHWREDIQLMRQLGVSHARYGIPWHKINPARGQWNWEFADQSLNLMLELGIEPIVDLVHYGLPAWIENAWLNPELPNYMAEYAERAASRFNDRIFLWTPLNEPRITAWYCGKLGWWPPAARGWRGFIRVMLGVCRCIVAVSQALKAVNRENIAVHVDATDLYESPDPQLASECAFRQEVVFLALDLISGRIAPGHSLWEWLLQLGCSEAELEWFSENAVDLEVIGINLYPLFSRKILKRTPRLRISMPYAPASIVEDLAQMYYQRYDTPIFIAETASLGGVTRRQLWLEQSIAAVRRVREKGVPLIGYTWWPMFALVTWAYRQGKHPPAYYLKQMGLWDLEVGAGDKLERVATPLVQAYQAYTARGSSMVGELAVPPKEKERSFCYV